MSNEEGTSTLGGTVGGKLARLVADASALRVAKTLPTYQRVANSVIGEWFATMDREAQAAMWPIMRQLVESPDLPPELKELLQSAGFPKGQWQAFLAQSVGSQALSVGLSDLLNNFLGPAVQGILRAAPTGLLSVEAAAQGVARGIFSESFGRDTAARQGLPSGRFSSLVRLNQHGVDPGAVIELVRRKRLGRNLALDYMREAGMTNQAASDLMNLAEYIESPQMLAEMWNRNIVSTGEGRDLAARSGASAEDFDRLRELGGQPLAPMELGEAFRRGFIDRARFNRGIVQGPVRNEWFDVLEKLQFRRMSTVDAADAVNQNFMSKGEGREVAQANGLDPDDFSVLLDTAGTPPGVSLAQEAWNRGLMSEGEFTQAFLESRIKNKYLPLLKATAKRLIPQETVRLLYRNGVYPRDKTLRTLQQHGFTAGDAAALVDVEDSRRIEETRQLTRAQIADLYEERMITFSDAMNMLLGLSYDENGARAILDLADLSRVKRFVSALVTRIRSGYVKRLIDEVTAVGLLDSAGIPPDQRQDLFALWDLERTTVVKDLTRSDLQRLFREGLMSHAVALARLQGIGYAESDARLLLELVAPEPEAVGEEV